MARIGVLLAGAMLPFLVTAASGADGPGDWPSWRGPLHNGVAPTGRPPVEWSETRNLRWKVSLPGPGHATPVVWGDRIFVMSAVNTERSGSESEPAQTSGLRSAAERQGIIALASHPQESQQPPAPQQRGRRREPRPAPTQVHQFVVSAYDRNTGEQIWSTVAREEVPHEPGHATASQASASPVTDGKHVWASFGSRGVYCLDWNGKVVWETDLGDMQTRNQFGEGSSPVLHGETLVLNWDHEGDSFIVALDKKTGRELWRQSRDEPTSWATPLVVEDGGRPLAIVPGSNRVRAYDIRNGEEVWRCGGLGLNCVPTPVAEDGIVWVMSGYREAAGMAIRYPGAQGDLTDGPAVLWRLEVGLSYVPSPLLQDGKLYFLEQFKGMLSCYELDSGKACFPQQRLEGIGNIYASLVGAGARIYVIDRSGVALVLEHREGLQVLATNRLDDGFDASPVIVGDTLYLRGHTSLYAVAGP